MNNSFKFIRAHGTKSAFEPGTIDHARSSSGNTPGFRNLVLTTTLPVTDGSFLSDAATNAGTNTGTKIDTIPGNCKVINVTVKLLNTDVSVTNNKTVFVFLSDDKGRDSVFTTNMTLLQCKVSDIEETGKTFTSAIPMGKPEIKPFDPDADADDTVQSVVELPKELFLYGAVINDKKGPRTTTVTIQLTVTILCP